MLPPRDILVSQWADENRVLTGGASAERGQWRTRSYQREPMDVLSPGHPCRQVVLLSAAQMMKTEVLLNFLGFIADVDPGPVLVVEPRTEDAKALSKDRVAPMFRSTPALRGKIAPVKSRDSNNTTLHKVFVNGAGHITFTGAISPSGLAMRPIRYALLDEVDRYPASAGTEGDPVSLAIQRTAEFQHNTKIVMASTPTIKGISRIEHGMERKRPARFLRAVPEVRSLPGARAGRRNRAGSGVARGHARGGDVPLRRLPRVDSASPESVDGRAWRVSRAEPFLTDSGLPHLAVDLAEAPVGFDRHRVRRGEEIARDAQGVHEHGPRGTVGREPRGADGRAGVVESLRAI